MVNQSKNLVTDMVGKTVHYIFLDPSTRSADPHEGVVHGVTYDAKEFAWYLLIQPDEPGSRMISLDHRSTRLIKSEAEPEWTEGP